MSHSQAEREFLRRFRETPAMYPRLGHIPPSHVDTYSGIEEIDEDSDQDEDSDEDEHSD
ncbi:hypothetical protein EV702DRAFT_1193324 [Suillus placidus]|uniref:Uncharacterized protein n=1 Tax=Suillus placidus TaxID=48579 RepID=A0A9P7A294_9AGAM|nr:hypothetical protein EV702DRAFT_1193324 [Suillus placidus]